MGLYSILHPTPTPRAICLHGMERDIFTLSNICDTKSDLELVRNLVAHGDAREGKWRGNWRMEWVASTLTPPPNVAYPALLKLMRTPRLPAVDWTDAPTDLNRLVRFWERRNLVSARVPSRSARAIQPAFRSSSTDGAPCSHTDRCRLAPALNIAMTRPPGLISFMKPGGILCWCNWNCDLPRISRN